MPVLGLSGLLGIWDFYRVYSLGVVPQGNLKLELISFQGVKHNARLVFLESVSLRKIRVGWMEVGEEEGLEFE